MKRLRQIFVAPGEEYGPLPIEKSPWHTIERRVSLPKEHWELILDFAEKIDFEKTKELRSCSHAIDDNDDDFIYISHQKLQELVSFIEVLEDKIFNAPPLITEATDSIPDEYINDEHVRMLKAVEAVFKESLLLNKPFRAWID